MDRLEEQPSLKPGSDNKVDMPESLSTMTHTELPSGNAVPKASFPAPVSVQRKRRAQRMVRRPQRLALGPASDHTAEITKAIELVMAIEIVRSVIQSCIAQRDHEASSCLGQESQSIETQGSDHAQVKKDTPSEDDAHIVSSDEKQMEEMKVFSSDQPAGSDAGRDPSIGDGVIVADVNAAEEIQVATSHSLQDAETDGAPGADQVTHFAEDILSTQSHTEDQSQIHEDHLPEINPEEDSVNEAASSSEPEGNAADLGRNQSPAIPETSLMSELTDLFPDLKDVHSDTKQDLNQQEIPAIGTSDHIKVLVTV